MSGIEAGACTLAYFSGSIPFGVLITRWRRGVDVREHGSGNMGATNVARVAGKGLGVVVLLLDALKGALPVALARARLSELPWAEQPWLQAGVGLCAFLGHVFPIWLSFRGGKGVATALGVLGALVPWAAVAGLIVYVACFVRFRVSSIGSLLGGLTALGVIMFLRSPEAYTAVSATLFVLMLWTHRGNLRRLMRREENKV